jgi:PiT family inorganic phosphate transporter
MSEAVTALATVASVFMGISIGASTVASAFGPVNSARSANVLRSALLAGIFALIGAIVQGASTTETVGSGIISGEIIIAQAAAILFVAATLVIISVMGDYPMPTAFTVIGAVVGSGLGFGNAVSWGSVAGIIGYWLIIPPLAVAIGYTLAKAIRKAVSREGSKREIRIALLAAGCYLSYSAGASAVGLAVGPLTTVYDSLYALLVLGGISILLGAWLYSPRIIRAISFDYSNIGPRRSFAALTTASILAQVGIYFGIPISFNQAIIAAIVGSGMVEGKSSSDNSKIIKTAAAWTGAFILAGSLTFVIGLIYTGYI